MLAPWKKSYDQPRQHIKKSRHLFANKGLYSQSYGFSSSHVWMWELNYKESWALKNWYFWTVVLEKTLDGLLECKEIQPVHPKSILNILWKDWCWSWNSNTLATWCKEWTHWKRPWCWERLKVGEEGDNKGWDGWMASLTQWTWVWVSSGSWWWTRKLAVHGVAKSWTQLNHWTELNINSSIKDTDFYPVAIWIFKYIDFYTCILYNMSELKILWQFGSHSLTLFFKLSLNKLLFLVYIFKGNSGCRICQYLIVFSLLFISL